jgi:2'-5' RNA ligase
MTRPTYAYGVVIMPPPDLIREIKQVREQHAILRTPVPPHITVKSPFLYRQTGALVVERLEAICEEWEPFELRLTGLGVFRNSILYARVGESELLECLHQRIVDGLDGFVETLQERYDGTAYTPHLTLADSLAPEDLVLAKKALNDLMFRRRFLVERIHLLRGRGRWDLVRSFPLGTH